MRRRSGSAVSAAHEPGPASGAAPGDVRVRLVFDERADLDLYVTGQARFGGFDPRAAEFRVEHARWSRSRR